MKAQHKVSHQRLHERLLQWWWIQLPLRVARWFPTLGSGLSDGLYLVRWPIIAGIGPLVALLLGLLLGALHQEATFTASSFVMALLIAVGLLSAHLGVWAIGGYAIGDLFLHRRSGVSTDVLDNVLQVQVPLLLSYVLFALAVVIIPLILTAIRLQIRQQPLSPRLLRLLEIVVYVSLSAGVIYLWAMAMVILIRPVYIWQGDQPTASAIVPLQERGWILSLTAVLATSIRLFLETRATSLRVARLAALMSQALQAISAQQSQHAVPWVVRLLVGAASLTLLMSGMIANWLEAGLVFVFITLVLWVRDQLRASSWPLLQPLAYVPWLIRFAIGLVLSYVLSRAIVSALWSYTQTFQPVLVATCLSVALLTLLTAVGQPVRHDAPPQPTPQPHG